MNEQIQLLRRQVRMVWPYRWIALVLSTVLAVAGWGYVLYMPNQYEGDSKIFVDTTSMLRPLLVGLAVDSSSLASTALLMKRTLLTRPNLEEVARKTDLDLTAETDKEFDELVTELAENITLSGTEKDNIYQISFRHADPGLAKRVVDELLNTFLESALGSTRTDTAVTQRFLDDQIAEYEKRLFEAEESLKEFKQKNVGVMPEDGKNYFTNLQAARDELEKANLALREAQNRRAELRRQLDGEAPVFGMIGDAFQPPGQTGSKYDERINALQAQLDQLLLQYTEKHPEVAGVMETIAMLEEKREEEFEAAAEEFASSGAPPSAMQSPVYREMRMALTEAEADVAGLATRAQAFEEKVAEFEKLVDTIPEIEAELKRLNRDYAINKENYEELLQRRESARLSQEVDQQADDVKLKVIEPPRAPLIPIGPNRIMFLSIVLAVSLGAGGGFAFILSQINPRFNTTDELKEFAQLPILGAISLVSNRRQRTERRMELAMFALVLVGFMSVYGGLVALEAMRIGLHDHVVNVVGKVL